MWQLQMRARFTLHKLSETVTGRNWSKTVEAEMNITHSKVLKNINNNFSLKNDHSKVTIRGTVAKMNAQP
jgi:hypothetical protein